MGNDQGEEINSDKVPQSEATTENQFTDTVTEPKTEQEEHPVANVEDSEGSPKSEKDAKVISNEEDDQPVPESQETPPPTPIAKEDKVRETISLKNAMCEEDYLYSLDPELNLDDVLSVQYSDEERDLLLQENEGNWSITGKPTKSRDWWVDVELPEKILRFACFINANPRLMWKDIPSDQVVKADKDYRAFLSPKLDIIGVSHRGRSHANKGTYRDDDFYFNYVDGIAISVVADGAGSAELSSTGSKVFSQCAGEFLSNILRQKKGALLKMLQDVQNNPQSQLFRPDFTKCLYEILPSAALQGRKKLMELAEHNQVPLKKYHTTALLSFSLPISDDNYFCAAFQVGDGITVALSDGKLDLLGEADSGNAPGETLFVTSNGIFDNATDLIKRIHICFTSSKPILISMTDGITDSYFKESLRVDDIDLWKQFISEIETADGTFKPAPEICDWLNYYIPQEHDDRTMTIVHYK